ncbi:helical backbone metal receptor [Mucilaginibacter sp. L196]|uniref:helical backbone metal receptor n=1 Tax=Mucilaginibacter sp. L196 TaxID=1641870 RepID=UPI00131D833F|nr:helical backbone metal receptor [Mucilaginibacter sp. L196]
MPVVYDQLKRKVLLDKIPKRIISIVPSQTELLFYLGLGNNIIGVTKFCTHPHHQTKHTTKIGGTKQLNIELIRELQPDLIIANKEENEQSQVDDLMNISPVWISDINDLPQALAMIESVGAIVNREAEANALVKAISNQFNALIKVKKPLTVAYLIWRKPYMVAGIDTFINSMLQLCGFINAFELNRYPHVDATILINANPDLVFLSSEPFPFTEKHIEEFKAILPNAKVILVDGEMFSWYGNRLLLAPEYFSSVIGSIV